MPRICAFEYRAERENLSFDAGADSSASALVLNKMDQVTDQGKETVQQLVERWNPYAPIMPAVRCDIKLEDLAERSPGPG